MRICWAIAWIASCADPRVYVEVPRRDGTKAIVFAVRAPEGLEPYAFDATGDARLELDVDAGGEPLSIEALLYDRELAELGLEPGRLTPVAELAELSPLGRISMIGRIEDNVFEGWSEAEASEDVAALRVVVRPGCPRFAEELVSLPSPFNIGFALMTGEDELLVGTRDGPIHFFSAAGLQSVDAPPALVTNAAFEDEEGVLWLASVEGTLWRGSFDRTELRLDASPVATSTLAFQPRYIAGREGEIYLLTKQGRVLRFEGGRVTLLYSLLPESDLGGIVYLGPQEVLAGMSTETRLVRITVDEAVEDSPNSLSFGITGLHRVPGYGILAGTGVGGGIFQRDDLGFWRGLDGSPIGVSVTCFAATESILIEAGAFGTISARLDGEWCPEQQVGAGDAAAIFPFREGWIVAQSPARSDSPATLVLLTEAN